MFSSKINFAIEMVIKRKIVILIEKLKGEGYFFYFRVMFVFLMKTARGYHLLYFSTFFIAS